MQLPRAQAPQEQLLARAQAPQVQVWMPMRAQVPAQVRAQARTPEAAAAERLATRLKQKGPAHPAHRLAREWVQEQTRVQEQEQEQEPTRLQLLTPLRW